MNKNTSNQLAALVFQVALHKSKEL